MGLTLKPAPSKSNSSPDQLEMVGAIAPVLRSTLVVMVLAKSVLLWVSACSSVMQGPKSLRPKLEPSMGMWDLMPSRVTLEPSAIGRPRPSSELFFSRTAPSAACLRLRSMAFWMRAWELPVPSSFRTSSEGLNAS